MHHAFIAGFVAAEGCFTGWHGSTKRTFVFSVGLGATDAGMCELMHDFFGVGTIVRSARRKAHYDDEVAYRVSAQRELLGVIVPFMDAHLPPSHKREQYLAWRAALLEYWEHDAKRVRACTVEGCDRPRRAHGLCRHHLSTGATGCDALRRAPDRESMGGWICGPATLGAVRDRAQR